MPTWPLLISNTYRCTGGDSRCSTLCSPVLHPFLMSNSHTLHPFFMSFEPVAHPLQAVVLATVPLFFPTVLEAVHSDWSVHLLRGPERLPTICKTSSNLLLPAASTAIEDQQHNMDVNNDIWVEEDLSGMAKLAGGRVLMWGRTLQQNKPGRGEGNLPSRSRRRRRRAPREKGRGTARVGSAIVCA